MLGKRIALLLNLALPLGGVAGQDGLPPIAADLEREALAYRIVDLPIPKTLCAEASSFLALDDGRIVVGTRRGEVYFVSGLEASPAEPRFELFASGLHEVFGLAMGPDQVIYVTQQAEVTRLLDLDADGDADRFETVTDGFGFAGEHEYTFGTDFDRNGQLWIALCLTGSYTSDHRFRGWCLRVSADGTVLPTCSGLRSPGGIAHIGAATFYTENQGPWNGTCALKQLRPGGFMGHPASLKWYSEAPNLGVRPLDPKGERSSRLHEEAGRIAELVPPAVWFPYRKMGQSASAIVVDRSQGAFGPFAGQAFVADYTLSLVMRVVLEEVGGLYQGACFPFREGFATGLIGATLTERGKLVVGGSSRGWPARGERPYALQRLEWTGAVPFEVHDMRLAPGGFVLTFTQPIDPVSARDPRSYRLGSYTYHYHGAYGSPEIDRLDDMDLRVAEVSADGRQVELAIAGLRIGYVHELRLDGVRSEGGESLVHPVGYYTLNRLR